MNADGRTCRILVLNPGSTSTKAALFEGELERATPVGPANVHVIADLEISHSAEELARFERVYDQMNFRESSVADSFGQQGVDTTGLDAVVGRGGLLRPLGGGSYSVSQAMLADLRSARNGEHPCNLGAELAVRFARRGGRSPQCPALIVDPVITDELMDAARVTGHPLIRRRSVFHALSQRGAARAAAIRLGMTYEKGNFLVAHMGGGISVGAHCRGRVADVSNALDGEGPMSAERTGALPLLPLLDMLESGGTTIDQMRHTILREGGLLAHLGTTDLREAEAMAQADDASAERARVVLDGMAYSIARAACSLLPAFTQAAGESPSPTEPDAIILTGGMARSSWLVARLTSMIGHIAPVVTVTGIEEMQAMALGALRVLRGQEPATEYPPEA